MKEGYVLLALVLACSVASAATTYYVRTDGGTCTQCTGKVDAPYPGSGNDKPCAWDHPFQALPPGGKPRIAGGDTLIIRRGSYRMGFGGSGDANCDQSFAWDCYMPPVPSGPDTAHPTRILGEGWNSGCANPPELWGAERAQRIFNLDGSSNVEISCLEITDRSSCLEDHAFDDSCSGEKMPCERDNPPFGDWASIGLHAQDSGNVHLSDLNIHGLASRGVQAGRLRDWTLERVRIVANGAAGWDGDLADDIGSSSSGTMLFQEVEVAYNGCGETWPSDAVNLDTCWGQQCGGYGDGFAAGSSEGHWIFQDCYMHHNVSDGIDLLYLRGNSRVTVSHLVSEGNAGNQLKTAGPAHVENSLLIGNCAFFYGRPFMQEGDSCRAMGGTYSIDFHRGDEVSLINSTITGQGDCLVDAGCNDSMSDDDDPDCDGTERLYIANTLFNGNTDWRQPWEKTCLFWYDDSLMPSDPSTIDYSLIYNTKDNPCPGSHDICGKNPRVKNSSLSSYNGHLLANSPAVNKGTPNGAPKGDLDDLARDARPDIGAYELNGAKTCTSSCVASAPESARSKVQVPFVAVVTPGAYCKGAIVYDWDFGDGTKHGTAASLTHSYTADGTYNWTMAATVQGQRCTQKGSIKISSTQPLPAITSISKAGGSEFGLRIKGRGYQDGVLVFIGSDAAPWPQTDRTGSSDLALSGGDSLMEKFPKGVAVKIRVVNPDGGEAAGSYTRR